MLLSYAWLQTYLKKLPPPEKLAELLMLHGLDVESVNSGNNFDHVVVGEIMAIKPHPNADKLRLADVMIAPGGSPQEIVCGAPNIEVGQKVPVALVGATLPNGITIEPRAIRGVTSNGMICAEDELGIGKSHAGVLVLDPKTKVGTPFAEVMGGADTVIDITTPANRADLMSVRGLAREIGAMLEHAAAFTEPNIQESKTAASKSITVDIANPALCSVFTARVIRGVSQPVTPADIVKRLSAAGMRSINVIVDITNYIMLEYGQPLHAYDAHNLAGATLTARLAHPGEQLVTLDGKSRALTPEMLAIADTGRVVGLAGVMGGKSTEVTAATTDLVLEAAIFNPVAIRKTSRRLGLLSEASKRFEKGLWPELTAAALDAAAAMIAEICGGTIEKGIVKTGTVNSPITTVKLAPTLIAERLGMKVSTATSKAVLKRLGFAVKGTAKLWTVTVPAWRPDVTLPEDIVDEVGRMVGYEKAPKIMPAGQAHKKELPESLRFKEEVKNILVDLGLTEIVSHAFYGGRATRGLGDHITIANPLDKTQQYLRKSLLPQLVEVLKHEADAGKDGAIFEIGRVFDPALNGEIAQHQRWKLAIGFSQKPGMERPLFFEEVIEKLQKELQAEFEAKDVSSNEDFLRGRRLKFTELDLAELMKKSAVKFGTWDPARHVKENVQYRELSKFPPITRDISFWWSLDEALIEKTIRDAKLPFLTDASQKETFSKDGKTSYAYSLVFQSSERTLTKSEIDAIMARLVTALEKLGATIR